MLSITRERFISLFNLGAALRGCQGNIGDANMLARFNSEFPGASISELAAYVFGYEDCYASAEDAIMLLAEHDDLVDGGDILSHSEEFWNGSVDLICFEHDDLVDGGELLTHSEEFWNRSADLS